MSDHPAEVFRVGKIEKHPNADRLGIVKLHDFIFVVGLDDFKEGDLAVFIEPDSVVPDTSSFEWLWANNEKAKAKKAFTGAIPEEYRRIKVKKIRGILSQGLVIKAGPLDKEGDDAAPSLGITHWNPAEPEEGDTEGPPRMRGGKPRTLRGWYKFLLFNVLRLLGSKRSSFPYCQQEKGPLLDLPKYDVENFYRYADVFEEGELVVATEKLDGSNARFIFHDGRMYCGSHAQWKKEGENPWWNALKQNPWIGTFCQTHPEYALYGEIYGGSIRKTKNTAPYPYGMREKAIGFKAFDVRFMGRWLDFHTARSLVSDADLDLYWVPVIWYGKFHKDTIMALSEGPSRLYPAHKLREGVVIRPERERFHRGLGRVQLKLKSKEYLMKDE
jgi:tRNA-binding EMAP/Myf-like protein